MLLRHCRCNFHIVDDPYTLSMLLPHCRCYFHILDATYTLSMLLLHFRCYLDIVDASSTLSFSTRSFSFPITQCYCTYTFFVVKNTSIRKSCRLFPLCEYTNIHCHLCLCNKTLEYNKISFDFFLYLSWNGFHSGLFVIILLHSRYLF